MKLLVDANLSPLDSANMAMMPRTSVTTICSSQAMRRS
jgi:hypothetical protein